MPDRPSDADDDRYGWLYGERRRGTPDASDTSDASRADDAADDDATRAISAGPSGPADPDATRAIPAAGPAGPDDPDATRAIPVPPQSAQPRSRTPPPAEPDRPRRSPQAPPDRQQPLSPPNLPPPGAAASRPPGGPDSKPRSRARIVRRVLLAVLLVWVLFLVAVPIWAWSQIEKVDASPAGDRPGDQDGTTYLVVGSDSREGLTEEERQDLSTGDAEGQRTDTIMLLHTGDGPTTLISLPRDSPVDIPGQDTAKINAAFAFGGPELLVETVEQNTGIRVDGYVEIGLGGFVNLVDALGGVEICPPQAIEDSKSGLDVEAGCQQADGPTALGYARTRAFATADLQRVQNQREVVSAIADDAFSPGTVLNPWRYFRLASAGSDAVRIGDDVGPVDLARFGWAMGEVSGGGKTCTVPLANAGAEWDVDRSEQLFRLVIEDRTDELDAALCSRSGLR